MRRTTDELLSLGGSLCVDPPNVVVVDVSSE